MKTEKNTLKNTLEELGVTMTAFNPRAEVCDDWPGVRFSIIISRGRSTFNTAYSMGTGHFPVKDLHASLHHLSARISDGIETLQRIPHTRFLDKSLHADIAAAVQKIKKITPEMDDVMHSLLLDGAAYFDAFSFEEWCAEYGYDTDSRKAESIYRHCDDTGRSLARMFTSAELSQLRDLANDM